MATFEGSPEDAPEDALEERLYEIWALGDAARTCYEQTSELEDLEQMVNHFRDALTFHPPGNLYRSHSLNDLGTALKDRFQQFERIEDLEDAIKYLNEALSLRPPGDPGRSIPLNNLALTLRDRYEQLGRIEDLEDAITYHREDLTLCPPGHPGRSAALNNLANTLADRYEQLGSIEDLEDSITHLHEALSLCPPGHPGRPSSLNNLAIALRDRYGQLGKIEDLEDSITYYHEALSIHPPGHPDHSTSLNNLAIALGDRYEQLGSIQDLEDSIAHHHEVLSVRPFGHPDRSSSLNNLAVVLYVRYEQLGKIEDLEDTITYHREGLALLPPGHLGRSATLNNLAIALGSRFGHLGRIEDLEDSITHHREDLSLHPPGHPDRSTSLNNLAIVLGDRYRQLGRIEDLEESIIHHHEALSVRPPGHPNRSSSLNNLAVVLGIRYRELGRIEDLDDAITYHHEDLALCAPGHPRRSGALNNLALALSARYGQFGRIEDLEGAITYHNEALSHHPSGHPDHSSLLNNLANALGDRYRRLGSVEDLKDTITRRQEALALCPPGHPLLSNLLLNLANTLLARYDQTRSRNDIEDFFNLIQQAANHSTSSLQNRLNAAEKWVYVARNHCDGSVLDAYSTILRLLDRHLILHPGIDSQHKFLASVDISIASDAASAAIDAGDLQKAIELLEQGRAILWSKMTAYRHPLDELRLVDEELADHFANLIAELEHLALSSEFQGLDNDRIKTPQTSEAQWRKMRDLSEKWDEAVDLIRKKQGFSNFLQTIPFEILREAAAEGPIIVINVSQYHSDAIILLVDNPPVLVPLPDVQPEDLAGLASQLDIAQNSPHITDPLKLIFPVLHKLWADIVYPVVERLHQLGIPEKSRIWWCPTSELCGLPLHAAGPYRRGQKNLPDRYISSYTPTISALIRARSNSVRQSVVPKVLVIGQPDDSLPHLQKEIDNIRRHRRRFVDVVVGEEARRDNVLDGLQEHSWAHFACHGYLDSAQPFQAAFQLHGDDDLTLLDLTQARLPNAELAFLSACHTAAADSSTPNETISLAAALQFCGFRSVVGTLWQMEDEVAPIISRVFYKHMFRNPGNKANVRDSAEALNNAIRTLRRLKAPLQFWIMFVHIGA